MRFLVMFAVFAAFYSFFNRIIIKTDIHNKLFDKPRERKYTKVIFALILICFALLFEYWRQLLNDSYGEHNYISLIVGAFLGSLYFNFVPLFFRRNK